MATQRELRDRMRTLLHDAGQLVREMAEVECEAQDAAQAQPPAPNTGSPKLLGEMEQFAVMCDRAGNGKDARCVRSWVKQLRASA